MLQTIIASLTLAACSLSAAPIVLPYASEIGFGKVYIAGNSGSLTFEDVGNGQYVADLGAVPVWNVTYEVNSGEPSAFEIELVLDLNGGVYAIPVSIDAMQFSSRTLLFAPNGGFQPAINLPGYEISFYSTQPTIVTSLNTTAPLSGYAVLQVTEAPEPTTWALMGVALVLLGRRRAAQFKRAAHRR